MCSPHEPHAPQSLAHVGLRMGYVRFIWGHLDLSWAHVGSQMGYVRLILGHLFGHLFGTNVYHSACWGCAGPKIAPNGPR